MSDLYLPLNQSLKVILTKFDQTSDAVLDALLTEDPESRVACETVVNTGLCLLTGEITSRTKLDYIKLVRNVIKEIGYEGSKAGGLTQIAVRS